MPQQRSEETRARILAAALDRFARYGYDATGVAEICRAAGVSKGAFYHHFPSKQAAFLESVEKPHHGNDGGAIARQDRPPAGLLPVLVALAAMGGAPALFLPSVGGFFNALPPPAFDTR